MDRIAPHGMRGSALITVTVIGLFVMLLASGLVNHFAVSEAKAVAESLARVRVYWAAMGHVNYALSRTHRIGLCGGSCANDDTSRADTLRSFLEELYNNASPGTQRDWDYGNDYTLSFKSTVEDLENSDDGRVRIKILLQNDTSSSFDTLVNLNARVPDLQLDVCVAAPCGSINSSTSGANKIEVLRRVQ